MIFWPKKKDRGEILRKDHCVSLDNNNTKFYLSVRGDKLVSVL